MSRSIKKPAGDGAARKVIDLTAERNRRGGWRLWVRGDRVVLDLGGVLREYEAVLTPAMAEEWARVLLRMARDARRAAKAAGR